MKQVVIENPVINSPFDEPNRHFKFTEDGITDEILEARRRSSYFIPIARPRGRGRQTQLHFDSEWTEDRLKENDEINRIRERVGVWRTGGYVGITKTTARLLEYWSNPEREKKLFFCQREALETAICITEVAGKYGDSWIDNYLFHAFRLREKNGAGKLTKSILTQGGESPFTETPEQMVRRVCRELGNKKNIVVINDEAHHCYRRRATEESEKLTGDERKEAEKREEEARVWISGLEAVKAKIGVKSVYDLSATPFFLRGSGYPEGTLFPWVVSDFSLIDAIECGIVKVPRVPVADDSMTIAQPTYRDLWLNIRDHLPKKGRKTDAVCRIRYDAARVRHAA